MTLVPGGGGARARALSLTVLAILTLASFPAPFSGASGTVPSFPIGQDQLLGTSNVNAGGTLGCEPGACSVDTAAARASSGASILDRSGSEDGEAYVGYQFNLHRVCDGQSTLAPFTLRQDYNWTFSADVPLLVRGSANHQVTMRSFEDDAALVVVTTTTGSGSGQAVKANVPVRTDRTYESSLGSRTTVEMTDTPVVEGEQVRGAGSVTTGALTIDFYDPVAPEFVSVATEPPASNPGSNGFLGYVNQDPAYVVAQARDPAVNAGGQNVVQSCVKEIAFFVGGALSAGDPGFAQGPVTSAPVFGQGRHSVDLTASDYQANLEATAASFVVDSVAPPNALGITPSMPTGEQGWYKIPRPSWQVTCVRDPNGIGASETAPCVKTEVSQDGGATWTNLGAGESFQLPVQEGGAVTLLAKSTDAAGNVGAVQAAGPVKVDVTLPVAGVTRSTSSAYGNGWHNQPTTITFACVQDVPSGCGEPTTWIDQGMPTPTASYTCNGEVQETIGYRIPDVAGNARTGTAFFGCDFTPPNPIDGFRISSDTYFNADTGQTYSNVTPVFEWFPAVDPGPVRSGIRMYEVRLNGVSHFVTIGTTFDHDAMKDGLNCVRVRAVDEAGNVGLFTPTQCIFVDRVDPTLTWNLPDPNTLYVYGTPIQVTGLSKGHAVVVGDLTVGVTVADNAPPGATASKVDDVHLILDIGVPVVPGAGAYEYAAASCTPSANEDRRVDGNCLNPCDNVNAQLVTCSWDDNTAGESLIAERTMFARTWDNAHNLDLEWQNYTKVGLAVVEESSGGVARNVLYFQRSVVPDFFAYVVEARLPGDPIWGEWHVIHTEPLAETNEVTDLIHPTQVGKTYEYRVKVQADSREIVSTSNVARIVANHVDGHIGSFE